MEDKRKIIIDRELLKNLIFRSHCWCAVAKHTDMLDDVDLQNLFMEYADSLGIAFPEDIDGYEALDIVSDYDIDFFYDLEEFYDKREND